MVQVAKNHAVFTIFALAMFWLMLSVAAASQFEEVPPSLLPWIGLVLVVSFASYALTLRLAAAFQPKWPELHMNWVLSANGMVGLLSCIFASIVVLHFVMLGEVPLLTSLSGASEIDVSLARQDGYFMLPVWMRYASDYALKSLGPALLLITVHMRSKWFYVVALFGVSYTTGLMARSLPLIFIVPTCLYLLLVRSWVRLIIATTIATLLVLFLTVVAVPSFRDGIKEQLDWTQAIEPNVTIEADTERAAGHSVETVAPYSSEGVSELALSAQNSALSSEGGGIVDSGESLVIDKGEVLSSRNSSVLTILERVVVVPGRVMHQWYRAFSDDQNHERGCAYRVLASLFGCAYSHIPTELYATYYSERVEEGMNGSLNAAFFMTDFANFGSLGFIVAGILSGVLLAVSRLIYGVGAVAVALNVPLIMSLMETNLFIALNSGSGWLLTTAIYVLIFYYAKQSKQRKQRREFPA